MLLNYEDFKASLLKNLQDLYEKDAKIGMEEIQRNNGKTEDGLWIRFEEPGAGESASAAPLFSLQKLYEDYKEEGPCMEDCVEFIYGRKEKDTGTAEIVKLADRIRDWLFVRERIYPVLLSTKENEKLLEDMISVPLLDLSVVYIIRMGNTKTAFYSVKVNRSLFEQYGISQEELHRQAIENLQRDGYRFQDMRTFLADFLPPDFLAEPQGMMYILTNRDSFYGAAGLLYSELLREFAGGRSFYILPSSMHETIFVEASESGAAREELDLLVQTVNETQVQKEEQLSSHSYYYDGVTGEIRMCA